MKSLASMDEDDVDQVLEPTHATTALSTHAEASKMLETALQQMDGIIAGTQQIDLRKVSLVSNPRPVSLQEALNQLQSTIKLVGADKRYVYNWVLNLIEMPEVEERLQRLEGDKDSLQMQISILMDQIEMQTEKISELEKSLMEERTTEALRRNHTIGGLITVICRNAPIGAVERDVKHQAALCRSRKRELRVEESVEAQ